MAKKKVTEEAPVTESKFVRGVTKADGSPWGTRRSNEELLTEWEAKLEKRKADHAKELANIEKKIAYFKNGGGGSRAVDPVKAAEAAKALLGQGMTPEQIAAFAEQARLASHALKGKTEEEIKAILTPPPFLAVATPV